MPGPVYNIVGPDGDTRSTDEEGLAYALERGYQLEDQAAATERTFRSERLAEFDNAPGAAISAGLGAVSSATLGLSDVALGALGAGDIVSDFYKANETAALGGQLVGALLPLGAAKLGLEGAALPAQLASNAGAKITAKVGGVAGGSAGAAFEAGLQSGGQYLSQVALGDKELSAEGFLGAVGSGSLFGGAFGGGFALAGKGLAKGKDVFGTYTKEAAEKAQAEATDAISASLQDADALQAAARRKLDGYHASRAAVDPEYAAMRAERHAAQMREAESKIAERTARTEGRQAIDAEKLRREQLRTERMLTRKPRKAFTNDAAPAPVEPVAPAAAPTPGATLAEPLSDLERQLAATQDALNSGASLKQLSTRNLADEADDVLAKVEPQAADLVQATKAQRMAKKDVSDWVASVRKKVSEGDSRALAKAATDEERQAIQTGIDNRFARQERGRLAVANPEESIPQWVRDKYAKGEHSTRYSVNTFKINKATEDLRGAADLTTPEAVTKALDEAVTSPVAHGVEFTAKEVDDAARVLGNYERANADLVAALGDEAQTLPAGIVSDAQAYQAAVVNQGESLATQTAAKIDDTVQAVDKATAGGGWLQRANSKLGTAGEVAKKAQDAAQALEMLELVGIDVPSARDIPVVGPLLSKYLRARAIMSTLQRAGVRLPKSVESTVAGKAKRLSEGAIKAIDKAFDVSIAGTKAVRGANQASNLLAHKLFDHDDKRKPANDWEAIQHRVDELQRAVQPGAIKQALAKSLPTADAELASHVENAAKRKAEFLLSKAPKVSGPVGLMSGFQARPSKAEISAFARYLDAAENPQKVFDSIADGSLTIEGVETIKACYPRLYQEAQARMLENASKLQSTLPYSLRLGLSLMFGVAVDASMQPDFVQYMQADGLPENPANNSMGPGQPGQPPTPTVSGNVTLGDRYTTSLDRRGAA